MKTFRFQLFFILLLATSMLLTGCPPAVQVVNQGNDSVAYQYNANGLPVCSHIHEHDIENWRMALGAVDIELGETSERPTPPEDEAFKGCGCSNIPVAVGNHYENSTPIQLPPDIQTSVEAIERPCSHISHSCSYANSETMEEDRKIGVIITLVRNHRNFHTRVGGFPPEVPGVIHIPGNDAFREDTYYVPGCQGAEAAGLQFGDGERGIITHQLLCEVNVRKIVQLEALGADYVYEQAGYCLEAQNLSPELDIDILNIRNFIHIDENNDDRERRAANFVSGNITIDPWPEVTECIREAVESYYQAPLRELYANKDYDYDQPDRDGDNICDLQDTCVDLPNQEDYPDPDDFVTSLDSFDRDNIGYSCDNCPDVANADQVDSDNDGFGDACDLCPHQEILHPDESQVGDDDEDGTGNACDFCFRDPDDDCDGDMLCNQNNEDPYPYDFLNREDGDTVQPCTLMENGAPLCPGVQLPTCDNCPSQANQDQNNTDGAADGGDACDTDDDNDNIPDVADSCPTTVNQNLDVDEDTIDDACDELVDQDGDQVADEHDNCLTDPNPDQTDGDHDGKGDACDTCPDLEAFHVDNDHDCVRDTLDNCSPPQNADEVAAARYSNEDQVDQDGDSRGDICDNCPNVQNPTQLDANHDGIGDACELPPQQPEQPIEQTLQLRFNPTPPPYISTAIFRDNMFRRDNPPTIAEYIIQGNLNQLRGGNIHYRIIRNDTNETVAEGTSVPTPQGSGTIRWSGILPGDISASGFSYTLILIADDNQTGQRYEIRHHFTVYGIRFYETRIKLDERGNLINNQERRPTFSLGLFTNTDNDDRRTGNFEKDHLQVGPVPYEDDIVALNFDITPLNLPATVTLQLQLQNNGPNGEPYVKFWNSPQRQGLVDFATPITLGQNSFTYYLEGITITPQGPTILLMVNSTISDDTGSYSSPVARELPINLTQVDVVKDKNNNSILECNDNQPENCGIGLVDQTNPPVDFLKIALWDQAFDQNFAVYNEADPSRNFIDRDSERFYIRMINPLANFLPDEKEFIDFIKIGTVHDDGIIFDDLTPIMLEETGPNTGVFVSKSQMLTTDRFTYLPEEEREFFDDINVCGSVDPEYGKYFCNDDFFPAHDGIQRTVFDDGPNDRTHMATIADQIRISYGGFLLDDINFTANFDVPVCSRNPDERKKLYIRALVFQEPYLDLGISQLNAQNQVEIIGQGDGQFTFNDYDGDRRCGCPDLDHDGVCEEVEEECEPFYDYFNDEAAEVHRFPFRNDAIISQYGKRGPVTNNYYLNVQIENANRLLQQACIEIHLAEIRYVENPLVDGVDIFAIAPPQQFTGDYANVLLSHFPDGNPYVLDFFVLPYTDQNWRGLTYLPRHRNGLTAVIAPASSSNNATLAHEIIHALTNRNNHAVVPIDYPPSFYPWAKKNKSIYDINGTRRLTREVIHDAHQVRPENDLRAVGNILLQPYSSSGPPLPPAPQNPPPGGIP